MQIHKDALIEQACSKDASRYVINLPYIDRSEAGKPVCVATDGKIMAIVPVSDLKDGEHGFLPISVLKAARKATMKAASEAQIEFGGENCRTFKLANGAILPDDVKSGMQYPNWRQVIPSADRPSVIKVSLNAELLAKLANALAAGEGVTLEIKDATSPIVVRPSYYGGTRAIAPTLPDAFGVIMPIKQPDAETPAPKTSADVPAYVA